MSGPNWALLSLSAGAFAIGVTEFTPMGLLPVIAQGVHVSVPKAGGLISAYAFGVMAGAPLMTLVLARYARKHALIGLMLLYTVGNLAAAASGDYTLLLLSRVLTSLAHGAFFGLGAVEASSVVAPTKRASAVATMFMGLTIANIFGVPAATWLGDTLGWRQAFVATSILGLIAAAALQCALPFAEAGPRPDAVRELRALMRGNVLMALAVTVIGAGAMFELYTYIAPMLEHITHAGPTLIAMALMLIGVGFSIGNAIGGRAADRSLDGTLLTFFPILGVIMLAFPFAATTSAGALIGVLIWGAASFSIMPALQMRVMKAAHDAPGLASSVNIGAFNLGNALGAALGGIVLSAGLGYALVSALGFGLAMIGVILVVLARRSHLAPEG
ncbi:transmembrane efflux protein [Neoasaia chiangmaiensis NBRC 101099]|uniref:MFS transporter n=1 Tax=Neoasaia chiangmaiensis TaxID=320497 RepID=A0A1U9KMT9_9PROT|nr:MFS transporter [Neoasaia chiangmaiensis]AQS87106.1 MFS transporter [Neoasaia chiangmaiensis]GBR38083.1 transmembrane efflux protein [Neoasaia chiangmaiensis NBRC 101099]GEN16061.1 MFS transporter [Neoasaia chiangmaiensis]